MMYSAYKLNKHSDNIQTWHTPFLIWNQSVVPCPVPTVDSWLAYRFLKRQVRWSDIPISWRIFQFIVIHTVKGFSIVNKAEIGVFLELSCFFHDPADVGNLISGSSAFSKTNLNIWKFTVHVLLKPSLENFEHYFTSLWDECSCVVAWAFFGILDQPLWQNVCVMDSLNCFPCRSASVCSCLSGTPPRFRSTEDPLSYFLAVMLVGVEHSATNLEKSLVVSCRIKHRPSLWRTPCHNLKEVKTGT